LPQWYLEQPQLVEGDAFYIKAFWNLHTCRSFGMGLGPIPWDKIIAYCHYKGLDEELVEPFVVIIRSMDAAYLDWSNKETEKRAKQTPIGNKRVKK